MDLFKGVVLSIIVLLHVVIVGKNDVGDPAPYVQAIYLGLIGFFIISGYFFKPGRGFKENMRRRIKILFLALMISAIGMSLISFAWCSIWGQPTDLDDLLLCLKRAFCCERIDVNYGDPVPWAICGFSAGYYFLWVVLGACVLFYAVADYIRDDWRKGAAAVAVLLAVTIAYRELFTITLPGFLNLSPIAAVFMIAGMYLAKFDLAGRIESAGVRSKKFWAAFIGCTAGAFAMVYALPPTINFEYMSFGDYGGYSAIPYVVEGVLVFIMLYFLFFFLSKVPFISHIFSEIGKHTMGILLLHIFVAKMILAPFITFDDVVSITGDFNGPLRIVMAFVTLILSYLICAYGPAIIKRLRAKE